jgi:hypothetical protein
LLCLLLLLELGLVKFRVSLLALFILGIRIFFERRHWLFLVSLFRLRFFSEHHLLRRSFLFVVEHCVHECIIIFTLALGGGRYLFWFRF